MITRGENNLTVTFALLKYFNKTNCTKTNHSSVSLKSQIVQRYENKNMLLIRLIRHQSEIHQSAMTTKMQAPMTTAMTMTATIPTTTTLRLTGRQAASRAQGQIQAGAGIGLILQGGEIGEEDEKGTVLHRAGKKKKNW